jgi:hypothetical protein
VFVERDALLRRRATMAGSAIPKVNAALISKMTDAGLVPSSFSVTWWSS